MIRDNCMEEEVAFTDTRMKFWVGRLGWEAGFGGWVRRLGQEIGFVRAGCLPAATKRTIFL